MRELLRGLVAVGGTLDVATLREAYSNGVFPWFNDQEGVPVQWWSPDPRTVIWADGFHCSRSLARRARDPTVSYGVDGDFVRTLELCGTAGGRDGEDRWLGPRMTAAYRALHDAGLPQRGRLHFAQAGGRDRVRVRDRAPRPFPTSGT